MAEMTRRRLLAGGAGLAGLILAAPFIRAEAANGGTDDYAELLARYVREAGDGINRVDYAAWQANAADRQLLTDFIAVQARMKPSAMMEGERFVFWTNLYNALTLKVVLEAYPISSIKNIKSKGRLVDFKGYLGPWRTKLVTVGGRSLSLDDIEHSELRAEFRDPRIHYAVNCASLGCPNLLAGPWLDSSLERDLDAAARAYVNHPRGVVIRPDGTLTVSSLYKWFKEDFGGTDAGIVRHLRLYADAPLADRLVGTSRISAHDYDWSLNDFARPS